MNDKEVAERVARAGLEAAAAGERMTAAIQLFAAAVLLGDGERAELHRQEAHAALDIALDTRAASMSLLLNQLRK